VHPHVAVLKMRQRLIDMHHRSSKAFTGNRGNLNQLDLLQTVAQLQLEQFYHEN